MSDTDNYLVYAEREKEQIVLNWENNKSEKVKANTSDSSFVVLSKNRNYLLKFDGPVKSACYIIEYQQKEDIENYCYYTMHKSKDLVECGLVKGNDYFPFKVFRNKKMTEYTYELDNESNLQKTKKEVYSGEYQDNPREHYPRVVFDALEELPKLPLNAKKEIAEYINRLVEEQKKYEVNIETDINKIDPLVETLIFKEAYLNEKLSDFVITGKQFPQLTRLVIRKNCQNSKEKCYDSVIITGCPNLKEIEAEENCLDWYYHYIIKGIISLYI